MGYSSQCPLCGVEIYDGELRSVCDCGYMQITQDGAVWTATHADPKVRQVNPNILVTEVLDDPPERGPASKRRGSSGEAALPDVGDGSEGQVDGDGGEAGMD